MAIDEKIGEFHPEEEETAVISEGLKVFQINREKCLHCGKDADFNVEDLFYLCSPCAKSLRNSLPE